MQRKVWDGAPGGAAGLDAAARDGRQPVTPRSIGKTYFELTKAKQTFMALATTAIGFYSAGRGALSWGIFAWTLAGAALAMSGASVLNEWAERKEDAGMERTRGRPLPSGGIRPGPALALALCMLAAGVLILAARVNALTAAITLSGALMYVLVYTPLKYRSELSTHIGALCGAAPPVIGWTAASGQLQFGALILGAILFVWQISHTLALTCYHRDDYARGGLRLLPVVDGAGHSTCRIILLYTATMTPVSILPALAGMGGWIYVSGAVSLGLVFLFFAVRLYQRRTADSARRLFLWSVAYLPLLLILLVADPTSLYKKPATPAPMCCPVTPHHGMDGAGMKH